MTAPSTAGVILCGGKSSRMGYSKAWLPFGPETMLQRVARILGSVVEQIVVVAAPEQDLPPLPGQPIITRDAHEGRGPLEGLRAGLSALPAGVEAAFATSCDVPLLEPAFIRYLLDALLLAQPAVSAAVPVEDRFAHPLAAVYRPSVLAVIDELIATNQMRPAFLFDRVPTARVAVESLRTVDLELRSLANLNRPEDYFAALTAAGLECSAEVRERLASG